MNKTPDNNNNDDDTELYFIGYINGKNESGEAFWAYLSIPGRKYDLFRAAISDDNFDPDEYGDIIEHGYGNKPPEDVRKRIMDTYYLEDGFDDQFEPTLEKMDARFSKESDE